MQESVKYLIVGQGLVGTWLSYFLQEKGIPYKIINDNNTQSASSVASGVINPVTGRRIVQTWLIETILPFAVNAYKDFQQKEGIEIIKEAPTLLIHPSEQMNESFQYRLNHDNVYLQQNNLKTWNSYFNIPHNSGLINSCYWIDIVRFLNKGRAKMKDHYIEEHFNIDDMTLLENGVQWKNIIADKIIFCDGIQSMNNPYFKKLPFTPNKGEALIVKIEGLPTNHIYKNNIAIVPWEKDLFWVGSSFEWSYQDSLPSNAFKQKMINSLDTFLKLPFKVIDHIVGIRPANAERRPFVGLHPKFPQLGICNGMGTKGCTLAPFFANQLIDHIENGFDIEAEANVNRFSNYLLSSHP